MEICERLGKIKCGVYGRHSLYVKPPYKVLQLDDVVIFTKNVDLDNQNLINLKCF